MSVPAPHFLLYPEAVCLKGREVAGAAKSLAHASKFYASGHAAEIRQGDEATVGRWRFVLRLPGGEKSLEATDIEGEPSAERLELLAIIRGLEALDQPSRVTLVASANVERGLKYGLAQWRENDWHWERYGRMTPVKNGDLWQRLDRLSEIHSLDCRPERPPVGDDLAPLPRIVQRAERRLRIDPAPAQAKHRSPLTTHHSPSTKHQTPLTRISNFALRAWHAVASAIKRIVE